MEILTKLAIVALVPGIASASVCRVCVQKQVVAQQVYVPSQVYYFVGAPVRVAQIQLDAGEQVQKDQEYQEFLEFKKWKQQLQSADVQEQNAEPPNAVQVHCGKCHGTQTPKSGYYLDGSPGISAETVTSAIRSIVSGEMPKDRKDNPLTNAEKGELLDVLLSLEAKPEEYGSDKPADGG